MFFITSFLIINLNFLEVSEVDSFITSLYHEDYQNAKKWADYLKKKYPNEGLGWLLEGIMWDLYMIDFSYRGKEKEFFENMRIAEKKFKKSLKNSKSNLDKANYYFLLGAVYFYKANRYYRKKSYLKAFFTAKKGLSYLIKGNKMNPNLYDAYIGTGLYKYAVGKMREKLSWLPFISRPKQLQGIKEIEIAANKGKMVNVLAKGLLVWIYLYEKRRRDALKVARELEKRFPNSRNILWTVVFAEKANGHYRKTKNLFLRIYNSAQIYQKNYPYALALIEYWLSKMSYLLNQKDEAYKWYNLAEKHFKEVKNYDIIDGDPVKFKGNLKKLKKMLKRKWGV